MRRGISSATIKTIIFSGVTVMIFLTLAIMVGNLSFAPGHSYRALFSDATGVEKGAPVRLAGVDVGRVTETRLVSGGAGTLAQLTFTVESSVPLYANAELDLRYENLVGARYVAIVEKPGNGQTALPGRVFSTSQTRPALNLTALFNGFQPLFTALDPHQINALSLEIVQTLQGEGGTVQQLLMNTAKVTNAIADRDAVIGRVVNNLTAVLTTVDERTDSLTELIEGFRRLMTGLASDSSTIGGSLPDLAQLLNTSGEFLGGVRSPLKGDVAALGDLAGKVASTRSTLDGLLQAMPNDVNTLTRVASYGSWFNYVLCGMDGNLSLNGQTVPLTTPSVQANTSDTACAKGGHR